MKTGEGFRIRLTRRTYRAFFTRRGRRQLDRERKLKVSGPDDLRGV